MYQTTNQQSSSLERRPTSRFIKNRTRLALEHLEDRVVLDVGDTIGAALDTGLGPAPGTYTLANEILGDGSFADRDVDLYQVQANAGSRLTARTTGNCTSATTDTVMRFFTAPGVQLAVDDDGGGGFCSMISFQFTAAGTYYVGISGYPNFSYNPNTGGSGDPGSTGNYGLTMTLEQGGRPAVDSGWYTTRGFHDPANTNYLVGQCAQCPPPDNMEYRNFFAFNLAGVDQPILSASLRVANPPGGYISPDATETWTIYDVNTPIPQLLAGGIQPAIFADLGTGTSYGAQTVSAADSGRNITVDLNGAAVAYLNSVRGGMAALGGALTTLSGAADQIVFAFSGLGTRELLLTFGTPAGPRIVSQTPVIATTETVSSVRVTFNVPVNPTTFTAADIADFFGPIGPIMVTSVTPVGGSGNTQFDVNFATQVITGFYALTIGPNIEDMMGNPMDQDEDGETGTFGDRYVAGFVIPGARVTSSQMTASPGVERIRLTFSRAMDPASFTPDQVYLLTPSGLVDILGAEAVAGSGNRQIDLVFPPQTEQGTYFYTVQAGVRDVWGNPLDQDGDFIGGESGEDDYSSSFNVSVAGGLRVLHFIDQAPRPDPYVPAYTNLGIVATFATSYPDFNTRLAAGGWDLVVYLQQNFNDVSSITPLGDYVTGGGRAIAATWIVNNNPPEAQRLAGFFGASYAGGTNFTSVTQIGHPIWAGIANPFQLSNAGWGVFSTGMQPTTGTSIGTFPGGSSALIVGNGGRTLLNGFVTDAPTNLTERVRFAQNEVAFLLGLAPPGPAQGGDQSEGPQADSALVLALATSSRSEGLVNLTGVSPASAVVPQSTSGQFDFTRTNLSQDAILELISAKAARQSSGDLFTLALTSL